MAPKLEGTLWSFWLDGTEVYQRTGGHICGFVPEHVPTRKGKVSWESRGGCVILYLDCIQPCVNHQPCDQPMVGIIIGKEQQKAVSGTCSIKYPEVSACCDALLVVTKPVERLEVLPANVLGTRDRMPHFLFTAVWSSPGQSKETCTRTALELPEDTKHR